MQSSKPGEHMMAFFDGLHKWKHIKLTPGNPMNVYCVKETTHLSICVLPVSSMGRTSIDDGRATIPRKLPISIIPRNSGFFPGETSRFTLASPNL
jgi:hypothetical protein